MKRLRVHYRGWGEDWPLGHLADDGRVLLMDRLFRRRGLRYPGPLDRLAFIGERAMGALRFVPAQEEDAETPDWDLATLADESARALDGEAGVALSELAVVGGSPHGAPPDC